MITIESVAILLIGIIATFLVSRHYYRKSRQRHLTPYIHFKSSILGRIDPEVKKFLKVQYQDSDVQELEQIQFVIANTGESAIRDCFEPLRLHVTSEARVLDASIVYIHPEGRKVDLRLHAGPDAKSIIEFLFPLLDKDEYFVAKLLIQGSIEVKDLAFTISAEGLPPNLTTYSLPYTRPEEGVGFLLEGIPAAIAGLAVFGGLSAAMVVSLLELGSARPYLSLFPIRNFLQSFSSTSAAILGAWLVTASLMLMALGMVFGLIYFLLHKRPPQPRFRLPIELRRKPTPW